MTAHVRELLPDLVLGELALERVDDVFDHLARCPECAAERDVLERVTSGLARALSPVDPSAAARDRLLHTVQSARRFADYDQRLAEHFDLSAETARLLLDRIDDPAVWGPGLLPGVQLIGVKMGPAYSGWLGCLMKVEPGVRFPWHRHTGQEVVLMLQGGCIDSDGSEFRAGDRLSHQAGTAHDFVVPKEWPSFIFAVRSLGFVIEDPPE